VQIDIFSLRLLLFPLHKPGHWMLLVIDLWIGQLYVFDSMAETSSLWTHNRRAVKDFQQAHGIDSLLQLVFDYTSRLAAAQIATGTELNNATAIDPRRWPLTVYGKDSRVVQQPNDYDCGVCVLENARAILMGHEWDYNAKSLSASRNLHFMMFLLCGLNQPCQHLSGNTRSNLYNTRWSIQELAHKLVCNSEDCSCRQGQAEHVSQGCRCQDVAESGIVGSNDDLSSAVSM
jgi:hypothetical protein